MNHRTSVASLNVQYKSAPWPTLYFEHQPPKREVWEQLLLASRIGGAAAISPYILMKALYEKISDLIN
jgi:hypothetical protein